MGAARSAAPLALALVTVVGGSSCGAPPLDRDGARAFTRDALVHAGLRGVTVAPTTSPCEVDGAPGWRTSATTDIGEVSLCISRDQGRALSVRDPGMTNAQFARLEGYREDPRAERALPLASASAVLLLVGVALRLSLLVRRDGG